MISPRCVKFRNTSQEMAAFGPFNDSWTVQPRTPNANHIYSFRIHWATSDLSVIGWTLKTLSRFSLHSRIRGHREETHVSKGNTNLNECTKDRCRVLQSTGRTLDTASGVMGDIREEFLVEIKPELMQKGQGWLTGAWWTQVMNQQKPSSS